VPRLLVLVGVACLLLACSAQTVAAVAPPRPTPIDVYNDFIADGKLDRVYPKTVLTALVNDASLNQYGDPLVMMQLRRAARQQLAGVGPATARPAIVGSPARAPRAVDASGTASYAGNAGTPQRTSKHTGLANRGHALSGEATAPAAAPSVHEAAAGSPLRRVGILGGVAAVTAAVLMAFAIRARR
jgi:hypothetical protein